MHQPRAWIDIDLDALAHNARVLRRTIPAGTRLGLMVKADGYGHGMLHAARAAIAGGADLLLVVSLDEALRLRAAGVTAPVMIVYPISSDAVAEAAAAEVQVSVGGVDSARRVIEAWRDLGAPPGTLRVHIEVDSGMGRGGIAPADLVDAVAELDATAGIELVGIWTHLADGADPDRSRAQIERYESALAAVAATGRALPLRHVAATEGVFVETAPAYDLVRVGLGYYGSLGLDIAASPALRALAAELRPAMTVIAKPVRLETLPTGSTVGYGGEWTAARPSRVATLPIGYADGWTRRYWPGAEALIRGQRVPLIGRVSMDSVCADVTDVPDATIEDEAVLLGAQGDERITVEALAALRGTVPNEVMCAFGPRLERRARGGGEG